MKPKVLIGCPTADSYDYCLEEFLDAVNKLSYPNCEVLFVDNSKTDDFFKRLKSKGLNVIKGKYFDDMRMRIAHNRNIIIEKVLEGNYDYLLSVDQDVILPAGVIETLLKFGKDIITGVYFSYFKHDGAVGLYPLLYAWSTEENFLELKEENKLPNGAKSADDIKIQLKEKDVEGSKLIEVKYCGSGCLLIKKDVLKKVKFGLFDEPEEKRTTDDIYFCDKARENGYKIYAFTGIKCKHLILDRLKKKDLFFVSP